MYGVYIVCFGREITKGTVLYGVYVRYFWKGNHQMYGLIRCICTVFLAGKSPNVWSYTVYIYSLANPSHKVCNTLCCCNHSLHVSVSCCNHSLHASVSCCDQPLYVYESCCYQPLHVFESCCDQPLYVYESCCYPFFVCI
jgi:hypothetical protein